MRDCYDIRCRVMPQPDGSFKCIGYHCANCGEPSGQYGHFSTDIEDFTCESKDDDA